MSLSLKELSNLLGFLQEEEIGNQTFDSYSSAFQKAGFSKQVNNFVFASDPFSLFRDLNLTVFFRA